MDMETFSFNVWKETLLKKEARVKMVCFSKDKDARDDEDDSSEPTSK